LNGKQIDIRTLGTGVFETSVDWRWQLVSGGPRGLLSTQALVLTDFATHFELTNGLTGVRVVKPSGNGSPQNKAPIQGVRLADGSWVATGPNYLYESYSKKRLSFATGYSLKVVESGPLLIKLEATYHLSRPEYTYGSGHPVVAVDTKTSTVTLAGNEYYW